MHGLWKFDEDLEKKVPTPTEIKKRLALVDYRKIIVDHDKSTVFLQKKGMGISLGGIAKGYAVDRAVAILRARRLPRRHRAGGRRPHVLGQQERRAVGDRHPRSARRRAATSSPR